jgi:hypothetical protein
MAGPVTTTTATTDRAPPAYPAGDPASGARGALLERSISLAARFHGALPARAGASVTTYFLRSFR